MTHSRLERLATTKLAHKTGQRYQVWQEGSHPQVITSEDMLRQKIAYIHNNPVKREYVDDPAHWRYSSHRDYLGETGLLPVSILGRDRPPLGGGAAGEYPGRAWAPEDYPSPWRCCQITM